MSASQRRTVRRALSHAAALAALLLVSACGLPRAGPNSDELTAPAEDVALPFEVVPVTDGVATQVTRDETLAFAQGFLRSAPQDVNLIGPGDSLAISVWENVDTGVLTGIGQRVALLPEVQVDLDGYLFVPYVGRIRAAGTSPDGLRRLITEGLREQTPDPQVEVRRIATRSATVSLIGSVAAPGIYPIEPGTRTILPMLSRAGGVNIEPEVAVVTLRRGSAFGTVWLQDLFDRPEFNIGLRSNDQIIVERDRRSFTALGSLGQQARVQFPTRNISALEALGLVGGLNQSISNPSGVFVFREEDPELANRVIPGGSFTAPVRVAYTIDLTQPAGMFTAADFRIRDGDIVYVTEAPFVRFQKVLQAISPLVNFASNVNSLTR
jgi:polysaccharide export outer membrane protein